MSKKRAPNKQSPELSADLFLTTALQLAEQSGDVHKLSLRNLGKALGVDPTAVYRYFPSKADLVDAMMKRLLQDLMPSAEELDGDWRVRLTALARRAHQVFSTYPALTIRLPSTAYVDVRTPIVDQITELGYEALRDAGLGDEHVVLFHEVLYTFMLGMGQVDGQYDEDLEAERRLMRAHVATISPEDFPNVRQLAHLMIADSPAIFDLFLAIYLKAIESYASSATE